MKALVFKGLAIALPVVVLLCIEVALRLAGVGDFRRAPFQPIPAQESAVALDPDYGQMFFKGFQPGVAFDPLDAEKSGEALRILALGGSTTAGFPYSWYYSFPARLEDQLAIALPGRHVEVANLGMTATNSFTLWALSEPVAAQQPDAVLIYSGHNEYYGAYGPAGTQGWTGTSVGLKRFLIGASTWGLVTGLSGLVAEEPSSERRTMMARVVRDASVELGGDVYAAGLAQYEANLRDALRQLERAHIPVFLATLTSNLAGQAPLGDEPDALAAYERGLRQLAAGDTAAARIDVLAAKEGDGLRFRAPEALNAVIRQLADEFSNVTLVDVQAAFQAASPGGLEGATLFTDHLHPNARGYALMADAFASAMHETLPDLRGVSPASPAPSEVDPVEAGLAHLQLAVLMNGYPFRKDRTPDEAETIARAQADSLAQTGRVPDALAVQVVLEGMPLPNALNAAIQDARAVPDTLSTLQLYDALLHWQPFNDELMETAVSYAIQAPTYDAETARLARYAALHSDGPFSLNALAAIALRQRDVERADALLAAVEQIAPESPEMLFNRARLLVMQGDTLAARSYFERYQAVAQP
ncbi:MAG: hypothetical protein Rubg2KO_28880 [Rubricoccaceae bacterium]